MPPITRSKTNQDSTNKRAKREASPHVEMTRQRSRIEANENKENTVPEESDREKQSNGNNLVNSSTDSLQDSVDRTVSLHYSVERRIFARIHNEFSAQDWRQVIWNATFRINDLKFWACMTYKGLGSIVQADLEKKDRWETEDERERTTGLRTLCTGIFGRGFAKKTSYQEKQDRLKTYVDLLKNDITQMMKKQKLKRNQCIFQFLEYIDYSGLDISEWINGDKQKFKSIIYGWPENSLDLHPIKPLVDLLQDRLRTEYSTNAEGEEFIKRTVEQWNNIPLEEAKKSIDETTARLEAVRKQRVY
jgi:hypothetical protein